MATPITWQSIARPNFDSVNKGLLQTAALFNSAVEGFKDPLKEANATVQQNWNQGKENNTNTLLNKFAGFKTAEEAQAALNSGAIAEMLGGFGAQVNGDAVRAAQQNLVSNLQKKAIEADVYDQNRLEISERPIVGQAQAAIARGDLPAAELLMQNASPKTQAMLSKDVFNRKLLDAEEERKNTKSKSDADTAAGQLKYWNDSTIINAVDASTRSKVADANIKTLEAKANSSGGAAAAAREAELSRGPLSAGTMDTPEGKANLVKILRDTYLLTDNAIKDVQENVNKQYSDGKFKVQRFKDGKPVLDKNNKPIFDVYPLPTLAVVDSVNKTSEWFDGKYWSRRGDKAANVLQKMLSNPKYVNEEVIPALALQRQADIQILMQRKNNVPSGKSGAMTAPVTSTENPLLIPED